MSTKVSQPEVTAEVVEQLGILPEEYDKICEFLNRKPNFTELSLYSVMWSEHCSYKNSIKWLKTLPKEGKHILTKAGEENAGVIDIGNGLGCAFKIESHNHPSAIEPYQGAATGVGGIHRDIFTMGARPVAALNSLRFGNLKEPKTRHLLKGVVKGIGDYGNAFGVPTVGGEVYFYDCYYHNPLVNAMSVGILDSKKMISAVSRGIGNPVYIVGSSTGKDGIHGATFASADITEDSSEKIPAVQVGDPFQEKLLLEATQELMKTDAVVGMQDMGAAGIACSTSEMSAKEGFGMNIWLEKVPARQANMQAFELLLSESQERMLVVVKKGHEKEVEAIFEKWDLNCAIIGEVTKGPMLKYYMNDEMVAEVPADSLVLGGGAPVYEREYSEPAYYKENQRFKISDLNEPDNLLAVAKDLIKRPNVASKKWIFEQYDSMVGIDNTSTNAPSDAAVIRVKGTETAIAMTVDCNPKLVYTDPYKGAFLAVAEAARNIVCSGGKPAAITNCLNFGNPYKPEVYWQFVNAIRGMGDACKMFGTPVTGGNVSFYNQSTDGGAVYPTPTIGMVGLLDSIEKRLTLNFKNTGDSIYLIGHIHNDINCSEYLALRAPEVKSGFPEFNPEDEFRMQSAIMQLNENKLLQSAHDLTEGGLFVALAESAFTNNNGFEIETAKNIRKDAFLFGESAGRVIVSVKESDIETFEQMLRQLNTPFFNIGKVTDSKSIKVDQEDWGSIHDWRNDWESALKNIMEA